MPPAVHIPFVPCVAVLLWATASAAVHPPNANRRQKASSPLSGSVPLADEADQVGGEIVLLQHRAGAVRVQPEPPSAADAPANSGSPSAAEELLKLVEFGKMPSANDVSKEADAPASSRAPSAAEELHRLVEFGEMPSDNESSKEATFGTNDSSKEAAFQDDEDGGEDGSQDGGEEIARRITEEKAFPALLSFWPCAGHPLLASFSVGLIIPPVILIAIVLALIFLAALHLLVLSPRAGARGRWWSMCGLVRETLPMAGLVIGFFCYGVAQEYLMTTDYEGRPFPSVPFLVFASRLATVFVSFAALLLRGEHIFPPASRWAAVPALSAVLGSFCQHESLRFVAFPAQAMLKSAKVIPTAVAGSLFSKGRKERDRRHGWIDLAFATVVLTCVAGFLLQDSGDRNLAFGVAVLIAYLCCDALTSNSERKIYDSYDGLSGRQLMFGVGLFSVAYSAAVVECTVGFHSMLEFLDKHPRAAAHVAALCASSAAGQLLLFSCLRRQGPATVASAMTVRQALSMAFSTWWFGHTVHQAQVACASLSFLVVLIAPLVRNISMRAGSDGALMTSQKSQKFVAFG